MAAQAVPSTKETPKNIEFVANTNQSQDNIVYDDSVQYYDEDPFCKFIFDRLNHVPPEHITYPSHRQTVFVDKTTNPLLNGHGPGQYSFDYNKESEAHWMKTRTTDYGGVISSRSERFEGGRSALDNDTYGATLYHPIKSWANNFDKSAYQQPQRGRLHTQANWNQHHIPKSIKSSIPNKDKHDNRSTRVRGHDVRRNSIQEYKRQQEYRYKDSADSVNGSSNGGGSQYWAPKRVFGEIRPHSFFASNSSRNLTFKVGHHGAVHEHSDGNEEEGIINPSSSGRLDNGGKKPYVPKTPLVAGIISANIAALNHNDAADEEATKAYLHKKLLKKLASRHENNALDEELKNELKVAPSQGFYNAVNHNQATSASNNTPAAGTSLTRLKNGEENNQKVSNKNATPSSKNVKVIAPPTVTFQTSPTDSGSKQQSFYQEKESNNLKDNHRNIDNDSMPFMSISYSYSSGGGGDAYIGSDGRLSTSNRHTKRSISSSVEIKDDLVLQVNHYKAPFPSLDGGKSSTSSQLDAAGGRRTPYVLTPVSPLKPSTQGKVPLHDDDGKKMESSQNLLNHSGAASKTSCDDASCDEQSVLSTKSVSEVLKTKDEILQSSPPAPSIVESGNDNDDAVDSTAFRVEEKGSHDSGSNMTNKDRHRNSDNTTAASSDVVFLSVTETELNEAMTAAGGDVRGDMTGVSGAISGENSVHEGSLAPGLSPRWYGSEVEDDGRSRIDNSKHSSRMTPQMLSKNGGVKVNSSINNHAQSQQSKLSTTSTKKPSPPIVLNRSGSVIFPRNTTSTTVIGPLMQQHSTTFSAEPLSPVSKDLRTMASTRQSVSSGGGQNINVSNSVSSSFGGQMNYNIDALLDFENGQQHTAPFQFNKSKNQGAMLFQPMEQKQQELGSTFAAVPTPTLLHTSNRRTFQVNPVDSGIGKGLALLSLNAITKGKKTKVYDGSKHESAYPPKTASSSKNNVLKNSGKQLFLSKNTNHTFDTENDDSKIFENIPSIEHDVNMLRSKLQKPPQTSSHVNLRKQEETLKNVTVNSSSNVEKYTYSSTSSRAAMSGMLSVSSPNSPLSPAKLSIAEENDVDKNVPDEKVATFESKDQQEKNKNEMEKKSVHEEDENMRLVTSKIEENLASRRTIVETENSRLLPGCPPSTPETTTLSLLQLQNQDVDQYASPTPILSTPSPKNSRLLHHRIPLSHESKSLIKNSGGNSSSSAYKFENQPVVTQGGDSIHDDREGEEGELNGSAAGAGEASNFSPQKKRPSIITPRQNHASELRRSSLSNGIIGQDGSSNGRGSQSNINKHFGGVCGPKSVLV